jgi:hypothetical protein
LSGIPGRLMINPSGRRTVLSHLSSAMAIGKLPVAVAGLVPNSANRHSTGYGQHADYIFGWKGDALQRAMNADCNVYCPTLKTQSVQAANTCTKPTLVREEVDRGACFMADETVRCTQLTRSRTPRTSWKQPHPVELDSIARLAAVYFPGELY